MQKILMKGNEAIAEAAVRAGCHCFCGYPITPSSEILEYLSWRLIELGRCFIQAESEISAISMVYGAASAGARVLTASSGPGISLKQEGISYIAAAELPAVIIDVQRYGSGLGIITPGQSSYLQATKGGGHGDYKLLVYAPSSVQEMVDLMPLAFEKAEEYRNPVMILSDGALGQMMEPVLLPDIKEYSINQPWALKGKGKKKPRVVSTSIYADRDNYDQKVIEKYNKMHLNEQKYESLMLEDAEVVLVAYGITARACKKAIITERNSGIRVGLIRPITLWPFPTKAFTEHTPKVKAFIVFEMSSLGQLVEDVRLAVNGSSPVYLEALGMKKPHAREICEVIEKVNKQLFGEDGNE